VRHSPAVALHDRHELTRPRRSPGLRVDPDAPPRSSSASRTLSKPAGAPIGSTHPSRRSL
jgi:hypothetical protein